MSANCCLHFSPDTFLVNIYRETTDSKLRIDNNKFTFMCYTIFIELFESLKID